MNGTLRKFARLLAPNHKRAEDLVCADQWHNEARLIAGLHSDFSQRTWRLLADIGDLLRLPVLGHLADRFGGPDVLVLDCRDQLFAAIFRVNSQPSGYLPSWPPCITLCKSDQASIGCAVHPSFGTASWSTLNGNVARQPKTGLRPAIYAGWPRRQPICWQSIRQTPLQWVIVVAVEALVTGLHPGTQRAHGRKFLDGEPDRLRCGRKAAIA